MRVPLAVGIAGLLALAAAYALGGGAGLFAAGAAACVAVLLAVRLSLPPADLPALRARKASASGVEGFPAYLRIESALLWAGTSRRHFDGVPRRLLWRLMVDTLADRRRIDAGRDPAAARALVGEDVWELLDQARPPSRDTGAPGVDAKTLERIVDRLEAL